MSDPKRTSTTSTSTTDERPPMTEADWFRRYNERPGDTVMSRTQGDPS